MRPLGRRALTRIVAAFAIVDALLAAAVGLSLWQDRRRASRREGFPIVREEQDALILGEALAGVRLASEPEYQDGRIEIRLVNDEEAKYSVAVELLNAQTGETLATTGRIDPGYHLEYLQLNEPMLPGEYLCLARLHVYSMESGAYLGTAARQMLVNVK